MSPVVDGCVSSVLLHCFTLRYLDQHNLAVPRGQPGFIDSLELFGPHVRSWITNSQEQLCAACRLGIETKAWHILQADSVRWLLEHFAHSNQCVAAHYAW